ncbi:MAG: TonB C-terminal domain-containing protein [Proteobacteria bacterium]|nr:TonB C-terminal domain-containing protein [Pseudomonadota bacterium]
MTAPTPKKRRKNRHSVSPGMHLGSALFSGIVNGAIGLLFVLSSGSQSPEPAAPVEASTIFCRYIDNGRLYQTEVSAPDWQTAEEMVCGAQVRDVRLSPLLLEGARLILEADTNPVLLAQRESCSCSQEERVPILQDFSIVEAPRLGTDDKKYALPTIINVKEEAQANTVTTEKTEAKRTQKPVAKEPTLDDLFAAAEFDPARPVSNYDLSGSRDGSRLSNSATGQGDPYLQKIKAMLDNTMVAPASVPQSQLRKLSAVAWLRVSNDGILTSWGFDKKSGNAAFDNMIEMTLKQFMMGGSKRFARPPAEWQFKPIPFRVEGKNIK